jgi:hypothetical protein
VPGRTEADYVGLVKEIMLPVVSTNVWPPDYSVRLASESASHPDNIRPKPHVFASGGYYAIIRPGGTAGSPYTGAMSVVTCPVCGANIPRPGGNAMVVSLHITSCRRSPRPKGG